MKSENKVLRIGGASGFWGDAGLATSQLLADHSLDVIVYDYLAEITMAILARARSKAPHLGFATDFVTDAMAPNLAGIAAQGVRIVSNAGGINPAGCAAALRNEIEKQGLSLRVAVVDGDDLMGQLDQIASTGPVDMFTGADFPPVEKVASINAYVGAFPIAKALAEGADIVVTGRCVDSAVTLGACIHHFGWQANDLDQLAGGSLAGHILECGPQATGGNFTDWEDVADTLAEIGYPIADIRADGSFDMRKPVRSGGVVSRGTVAEQMLYEIGDPQAYLLPDVTCDFSNVTIRETGADQVHVCGARGMTPPDHYKTCLTWLDGYRSGHLFTFYGLDADRKAKVFADAALTRARSRLRQMNAPDFSEVSVELLGAESQFGAMGHGEKPREVVAKIAVRHADAKGVGVFLKEATGMGLSAPPGLSGFAGGRPKPSPVLALFSYLTPKSDVSISVDGAVQSIADCPGFDPETIQRPPMPPKPDLSGETVTVPLIDLAWGRSGDKGDIANVGLIARRPEFLPYIWQGVTDDLLQKVFGHFVDGSIERFLLPGSDAMNILLHMALGGGGTQSLRNDPQGKGYAQLLLAAPVSIKASLLKDQP